MKKKSVVSWGVRLGSLALVAGVVGTIELNASNMNQTADAQPRNQTDNQAQNGQDNSSQTPGGGKIVLKKHGRGANGSYGNGGSSSGDGSDGFSSGDKSGVIGGSDGSSSGDNSGVIGGSDGFSSGDNSGVIGGGNDSFSSGDSSSPFTAPSQGGGFSNHSTTRGS